MHLKAQDLANIPAQLIKNYQKHLQKETVAYLGEQATPVLEQLF